ncbi:MAG: 30S ribosomal protein S20 [bacterium]
MANIKSAKKRAKTNEKRRQKNVARYSEIKSLAKKVLLFLEQGEVGEAKECLRLTESKVARACNKHVFKKNTAARKISRLAKKVAIAEKVPTAS